MSNLFWLTEAQMARLTGWVTGWLRQSSRMGSSLRPIEGLITEADVNAVQSDWPAACDRMYKHARRRIKGHCQVG